MEMFRINMTLTTDKILSYGSQYLLRLNVTDTALISSLYVCMVNIELKYNFLESYYRKAFDP